MKFKKKSFSLLKIKKNTPEGWKAMNHMLSGAFIWEKIKKNIKKQ